ncbi:hypothetical protein [Taibaiella chishuiensis]|uniref:Uncharacterized protein n=1 Tax=Taibaiella chishuiensis TaxID=1434707 RepID=A0A2P8DCP4_9BACT|nr:hypothetical protein [Taibaiella chishuiensis]PSK94993.1 hypothetical protein B0I18_1011157 [Taibaiella chishuiensis]
MLNGFFSGLLLILLGILAVPSLLLSRKPEARELLDKITPYQGWIGVVFCVIGLLNLVDGLFRLNILFYFPMYGLLFFAVALVMALLGFVLGYGLIQKYALSRNNAASEKGAALLARIRPMQGRLGILAIILGIVLIILAFSFRI